MDITAIKTRVEKLSTPIDRSLENVNQRLQGLLTVMSSVYGEESQQVKTLLTNIADIRAEARGDSMTAYNMGQVVIGTIKNLKEEIESGFLGSLQKRIASEILTDFIQLAKTVLEDKSDNAKNVSSVLAAAAFEDTIRRIGSSFAGLIGHDKLDKVIDDLKKAGLLQSPQLGIAISYLSFRNHALHANWENIDRASVQSVIGFVEQLLLKYFQ